MTTGRRSSIVQQGEIVEYASNCADPIVHKAGDLRPEVFGTSHWWKNLGTETVILYVGDVRKDPHDHKLTICNERAHASLPDVTSRGPPVLPRTPRRHIPSLLSGLRRSDRAYGRHIRCHEIREPWKCTIIRRAWCCDR